MTTLLVDIGNTATKWAVADEHGLLGISGVATWRQWDEIVARYMVEKAIVCATGKEKAVHCDALGELGVEVATLDGLDLSKGLAGLSGIDYATPTTLGQDRLAVACGAWDLAKGPCVVIDAGTCITIDFVDSNGIYRGGAILPSAELQLLAMHQHTARLPLPDIDYEGYYHPLGRSTTEALLDGAICGTRYAVSGIVDYYRRQSSDLCVIYTGGVGMFVCGGLKEARYVDDLLFRGLMAIGHGLSRCQKGGDSC